MRSALLACLLLAPGPLAQAAPFLDWDGLRPGPHEVGYRTVASWDASRSFGSPRDYRGQPRPEHARRFVPVSIWYPARPGGRTMAYRDYVEELGWGPDGKALPERRDAELRYIQDITPLASPPSAEAMGRVLGQGVLARRDAPPLGGRFPVVVYAPGSTYPAFDNSVLCEFLASHGYVVLASPSVGQDTWRMGSDLLGLEAQARDLEYLAGFARTLPQADPERTATVGFSWGGLSNVLFALRDTRIKAVVSLDGAIRSEALLQQARRLLHFAPERLRAAFLLLQCGQETSIPGFGDRGFLEEARFADVARVVVRKARHHDLSSFSSLLRRASQPGASRDWKAETRAYEALCRVSLGFLDEHLKGQPRDYLGAEKDLVDVALAREASPAPPSAADLLDALRAEGPDGLAALVRSVKRDRPEALPPLERVLNLAGYELLYGGQAPAAVAVLALNVELFPHSWNARDSLGEASLAAGRLDEAERCYLEERRLLEAATELAPAEKARFEASVEAGLGEVAKRRAR